MVARNQIAQMKQPATKIAGLVAEELHLIVKDALKKVWQMSEINIALYGVGIKERFAHLKDSSIPQNYNDKHSL